MKNRDNTNIKWVINFKDNKPTSIEKHLPKKEHPSLGLLKPYLEDTKGASLEAVEWEAQEKALESLKKIESACKKIKGDYLEALEHKYDIPEEEKALEVAHNLKHLFALIMELAKLISQFKPSKDNPPGERDEKDG